jgi:hypothetical protein
LILDGKVVAQKVLDEVRVGVTRLRDTTRAVPTLAVVLVGDFAPSKIYVANKKKAADSVGIASEDHLHPAGLDRAGLLALLGRLNADPRVHGILLPGSTRTRRSPRSIPRRMWTACIRSTSGGCSRALRRSCRARPRAAWRSSIIMDAS